MNFSDALNLIKTGNKMTRIGWNVKYKFVILVPGSTFNIEREQVPTKYRTHIDLSDADGTISIWFPNNIDILADDWILYE